MAQVTYKPMFVRIFSFLLFLFGSSLPLLVLLVSLLHFLSSLPLTPLAAAVSFLGEVYCLGQDILPLQQPPIFCNGNKLAQFLSEQVTHRE